MINMSVLTKAQITNVIGSLQLVLEEMSSNDILMNHQDEVRNIISELEHVIKNANVESNSSDVKPLADEVVDEIVSQVAKASSAFDSGTFIEEIQELNPQQVAFTNVPSKPMLYSPKGEPMLVNFQRQTYKLIGIGRNTIYLRDSKEESKVIKVNLNHKGLVLGVNEYNDEYFDELSFRLNGPDQGDRRSQPIRKFVPRTIRTNAAEEMWSVILGLLGGDEPKKWNSSLKYLKTNFEIVANGPEGYSLKESGAICDFERLVVGTNGG